MDFQGKVVVVTGASSGIGKATSIDFAKEGAQVVCVSRNGEKIKKVVDEIKSFNGKSIGVTCDVSSHALVKRMVDKVYEQFGRVDVLVNCAGFGIYKSLKDHSIDEMEELMKTNYFGTVYTTKEVLPIMENQGTGHIVNIASMAGKLSFPNYSAYCASKFAVVGFTQSLRIELEQKNIGVSLICPAGAKTNFYDHPSFEGHPHKTDPESMLNPHDVSRTIIDAVKSNKAEVHLPWTENVILAGKGAFPTIFRKFQSLKHKRREKEFTSG